jgi:hypothetical protein
MVVWQDMKSPISDLHRLNDLYLPTGSEAVDDGLGFPQAHASQLPVTPDGVNLLAGRDQSNDVGRDAVVGSAGGW